MSLLQALGRDLIPSSFRLEIPFPAVAGLRSHILLAVSRRESGEATLCFLPHGPIHLQATESLPLAEPSSHLISTLLGL